MNTVACSHVQAGAEGVLSLNVGGTPVVFCIVCVTHIVQIAHNTLTVRNADPSQGHGENLAGGLLEGGTPPVVIRESTDDARPT